MVIIPVTIHSCVFLRDNLRRDITKFKKIEKRETYLSQKKITEYKLFSAYIKKKLHFIFSNKLAELSNYY